jgi:hypothetical protein
VDSGTAPWPPVTPSLEPEPAVLQALPSVMPGSAAERMAVPGQRSATTLPAFGSAVEPPPLGFQSHPPAFQPIARSIEPPPVPSGQFTARSGQLRLAERVGSIGLGPKGRRDQQADGQDRRQTCSSDHRFLHSLPVSI